MVTIVFGFFPLTGILVAALLYAVYCGVLRLKATARASQVFIVMAMAAALVLTFVSPARLVERPVAAAQTGVAAGGGVASPQAAHGVAGTDYPGAAVAGAETAVRAAEPRTAWADLIAGSNPSRLLGLVYVAGVVAMLLYLVAQLLLFVRERRRHQLTAVSATASVYTTDYAQPFSFGRSIFLPSALSDEVRRYAYVHELAHVRHHHFLKLCLTQLLLAAEWFNPFVWLLFGELKLQQELEVDADVLSQGIDRQHYQLSLLQMTIQRSRWMLVQSAFGAKPIKQRIIFMNQTLNTPTLHRRLTTAAVAALLVLATTVAAACRVNEQQMPAAHHAIYGVWKMDFTRPADSQEEIYPPFRQYAFYSDDVFFTPHFSYRDGSNLRFGYSGEGLSLRGDTLVGGRGFPIVYRFLNDQTFQSDWTKEGGDLSLADGKVNTDQWSKVVPEAWFTDLFRTACAAGETLKKPLDGVWYDERSQGWLLANGGTVLLLFYNQPDSSVYRFSGWGAFCEVSYEADHSLRFGGVLGETGPCQWEQPDSDHLLINSPDGVKAGKPFFGHPSTLVRKPLPETIRRMLQAALIGSPS